MVRHRSLARGCLQVAVQLLFFADVDELREKFGVALQMMILRGLLGVNRSFSQRNLLI